MLFWSDWNRAAPKIERSEADGAHRRVLIGADVQLPNALTIDYRTERLCWTDAGLLRVECSDLDGGQRRVVRHGVKYPFGLANHAGRLYWTDWLEKVSPPSPPRPRPRPPSPPARRQRRPCPHGNRIGR